MCIFMRSRQGYRERGSWRTRSALPEGRGPRSEEHTSELQSHSDLVCRLLLENKNKHALTAVTHNYRITDSRATIRTAWLGGTLTDAINGVRTDRTRMARILTLCDSLYQYIDI